ncbi:hypothetical protein ADK75_34195 [Streptomyces virginiae]|uniref:Uncharacterized protein n=1 Tax=Streptomyces virginiae TaxID=1961 RepID=A0A0L8M3A2_STRVG|nr:hypothetical protein B6R96_07955 [Streptomyces sp. Sge12]KOG44814.1 hypothetical protein ADK75_34195 [Streptomyces virginiae]KOU18783.1 hypothetical protein ADK51_28075 [Streptomyces sp. WM6368]
MVLDLRLGEVVRIISVKVSSIYLTAVASVVLAMGVQAVSGPVVAQASVQSVSAAANEGEAPIPVATPEDDQWT